MYMYVDIYCNRKAAILWLLGQPSYIWRRCTGTYNFKYINILYLHVSFSNFNWCPKIRSLATSLTRKCVIKKIHFHVEEFIFVYIGNIGNSQLAYLSQTQESAWIYLNMYMYTYMHRCLYTIWKRLTSGLRTSMYRYQLSGNVGRNTPKTWVGFQVCSTCNTYGSILRPVVNLSRGFRKIDFISTPRTQHREPMRNLLAKMIYSKNSLVEATLSPGFMKRSQPRQTKLASRKWSRSQIFNGPQNKPVNFSFSWIFYENLRIYKCYFSPSHVG